MPLNFIRSAKAPTTSAGVMIAKVIWKARKSDSGIVPLTESTVTPLSKALSRLPITHCHWPPSPKARL